MKQILFTLLFACALFAKEVQIVVDVEGDVASTSTVTRLVRDAVVQNGDSPVEESDNKLNVSLMPLGYSIVVVGELEKNGKAKNSAKLKAENPEELDIILERVVSATLKSESVKENEEVGKIAEQEKDEMEVRKGVRKYKSFGVGPTLWHDTHGNTSFLFAFDAKVLFEVAPLWAIMMQGDFAVGVNPSVNHMDFVVGPRYYFTATRFSPFVGLGFGVGAFIHNISDQNRHGYGFAGSAQAGLVMFRTSAAQLEIGLHYGYILDGFDPSEGTGKAGLYLGLNI
ncbi:MAG: hypothetical protein K6A31_10260 [Fibrobacter sp.]|nr:hypothetical protein [Fibrobacter sp.]